MKRLIVIAALVPMACIDAAYDDYCTTHSCIQLEDAGCARGASLECPASSCLALGTIDAGSYWIDNLRDGGPASFLKCDSAGWTLVATATGGVSPGWLLSNVQTATTISVDAIPLAMASTQLRLSGGTHWVAWPLPSQRTAATLWRSVSTQIEPVTAATSEGTTSACFQSATGVAWRSEQNGAYPAAAADDAGTSVAADNCLMVGVQGDGGPGSDAPTGDTDWPNAQLGGQPTVQVWLR